MRPYAISTVALLVLLAALPSSRAEEIGCVTTAWKLLGANHRVCVEAFDDPRVPGVACHIARAKAGGLEGTFGLAEDPARFSIACRQIGPIVLPPGLEEDEVVFDEDTSILFKQTKVVRLYDKARRTLVYLVYSRKLIDGSPMNSVSTVPIRPWP